MTEEIDFTDEELEFMIRFVSKAILFAERGFKGFELAFNEKENSDVDKGKNLLEKLKKIRNQNGR